MKKIFIFVLAVFMCVSFISCGSKSNEFITDDSLNANEQFNDMENLISDIVDENSTDEVLNFVMVNDSDFEFEIVEYGANIISYIGAETSIEVPEKLGGVDVVSISEGAFNEAGVAAIKLPNTILKISDKAFYYCASLNQVVFGDNINEVGNSAFMGCFSLNKVVFNNNLKVIGDRAFASCTSLKNIDIPLSVNKIGVSAFIMSGLEKLIIHENVNEIGDSSFRACNSMKSVEILNGIEKLNCEVFQACTSLEKITIPESVTEIDMSALQQCENLTIYGVPGSAAEEYAKTYDVNFQAI